MNEEKITIWEERIHACQNSDLTVAAWCREHQISVATYYYWRKRVSAGYSDPKVHPFRFIRAPFSGNIEQCIPVQRAPLIWLNDP